MLCVSKWLHLLFVWGSGRTGGGSRFHAVDFPPRLVRRYCYTAGLVLLLLYVVHRPPKMYTDHLFVLSSFLIFSFFLASCLVCWLTYVLPSCRSFSLFFLFIVCWLPCFPPHRPYALCRYLHPLLRVVFVREAAVYLFRVFWFCPCNSSYLGVVLFCLCNRYLFVFSTYVVLAAFPFRSSCIAFFRTPLVRLFVLFCSVFSLVFSPFFPLFSMVWLVLLCVLVPGTLAFSLASPDCDCLGFSVSLQSVTTEFARISTDSGCTDVVG